MTVGQGYEAKGPKIDHPTSLAPLTPEHALAENVLCSSHLANLGAYLQSRRMLVQSDKRSKSGQMAGTIRHDVVAIRYPRSHRCAEDAAGIGRRGNFSPSPRFRC